MRKINTNKIFDDLLKELCIDFDTIDLELPNKLKELVSGDIVESNDCISLTTLTKRNFADITIDKTGVENFENHFHIEDYLDDSVKENLLTIICFGLATIKYLVQKFEYGKFNSIRFDLSVETKELSQNLAKQLTMQDDLHYNGCRLTFYKIRPGENILTENLNDYKFSGVMTIDI